MYCFENDFVKITKFVKSDFYLNIYIDEVKHYCIEESEKRYLPKILTHPKYLNKEIPLEKFEIKNELKEFDYKKHKVFINYYQYDADYNNFIYNLLYQIYGYYELRKEIPELKLLTNKISGPIGELRNEIFKLLDINDIIYFNKFEKNNSQKLSCGEIYVPELINQYVFFNKFSEKLNELVIKNSVSVVNYDKIFITRFESSMKNKYLDGKKVLINCYEVSNYLRKYGYKTINLENYNLLEKYKIINNAKKIIVELEEPCTDIIFCNKECEVKIITFEGIGGSSFKLYRHLLKCLELKGEVLKVGTIYDDEEKQNWIIERNNFNKLLTVNLIVPTNIISESFHNQPNFLLLQSTENIVLYDCIKAIKGYDKVFITVSRKDFDNFIGKKSFLDKKLKDIKYELLIIDEDNLSESETIYKTIKHYNINDPIFIKDVETYFEYQIDINNQICYLTLDEETKNKENKFYIQNNLSNEVSDIIEKRIISDKYCVGGYSFKNSQLYVDAYEYLKSYNENNNFNTVHMIKYLLNDNVFKIKEVKNYKDLGSYDEWVTYKNSFKTLFLDIDNLFQDNFDKKTDEETEKLIKLINSLNKTQLILTTSYPEEERENIEETLKKHKLKYKQIIMGLYHVKMHLVNDFSLTNPYPNSIAINLETETEKLEKLI